MENSFKVPFDKTRNELLRNPSSWPKQDVDWRENKEFTDTLIFEGVGKGYSPPTFKFSDSYDNIYHMTNVELPNLLSKANIEFGEVSGVWRVERKHSEYGLVFVK